MVLVNTLTVEAINTALIALQRGQSIVVGGEKGTTVNNITISNSGGGSGGSGLDFTPQINALDKRVGLLEKAEEVLRLENERQEERITALEGLGINDFFFDETSRDLTIELQNGETFETTITSESFSMYIDNGELVIKIGNQERRVPVSQGVQADWTETDSSDPSFIKNKIPIWITDGSADDNMSPIDSVVDGSQRPITSNAVYDALQDVAADIPVYPTLADAEADLPNLEVGDFIATEQGGDGITDTITSGDLRAITSNAVAQAISYSETEHIVGYYSDGDLLYERTFTFNLTGTSSGDTVNFNLPSEFANYYVVKIDATLERNNYTLVSGMNKYFSVWKGSYTTITIQQEMTNTTTSLIAFVHLYYEKA